MLSKVRACYGLRCEGWLKYLIRQRQHARARVAVVQLRTPQTLHGGPAFTVFPAIVLAFNECVLPSSFSNSAVAMVGKGGDAGSREQHVETI